MAQIITPEEARSLGLRHIGKKHPVRAMIEVMEPGELLHVTREDFKWKGQTPLRFCNAIMKATTKKFSLMKTQNRNGWVVERMV